MGPGGLNFRVRDGNGCGPSGMITGKTSKRSAFSRQHKSGFRQAEYRSLFLNSAASERPWSVVSNSHTFAGHESLITNHGFYVLGRNYGQAERAIRTSQLNALLRLHLWPIDVVVFDGPSEGSQWVAPTVHPWEIISWGVLHA